jgi:hypothetical protein
MPHRQQQRKKSFFHGILLQRPRVEIIVSLFLYKDGAAPFRITKLIQQHDGLDILPRHADLAARDVQQSWAMRCVVITPSSSVGHIPRPRRR